MLNRFAACLALIMSGPALGRCMSRVTRWIAIVLGGVPANCPTTPPAHEKEGVSYPGKTKSRYPDPNTGSVTPPAIPVHRTPGKEPLRANSGAQSGLSKE